MSENGEQSRHRCAYYGQKMKTNPINLLLDRWDSPIDPLLLVTDTDGVLRAIDFADGEKRMHRLLRSHYGTYSLKEGAAPASLKRALKAYFEGDMEALKDLPTATG